MRTVAILVLLISALLTLSAQEPVKKDLMQMLEKIPPPPATVKDAYTIITANNGNGELNCSAENLFKPIEQEIKEVETEYEAQSKASTGSLVPGLSANDAKTMSDPEMRKKMKKMSKEEKMKMAMEMMNSMPAGRPATEMDPPPVLAALDEWHKLSKDTQVEFQRSVDEQQKESKLVAEYEKSHTEIDSWETEEIHKLPQISSGEMSAPDPAKVKAVKLKSSDKHIALANKRLEQIRTQWRASLNHAKARYTAFNQKLVAANYAADSKNFASKKVLSDAQMMILQSVVYHTKQSRSAWEESASWQARRVSIEKE